MTIKIPGEVGWKQTNRSDVQGSLWSTFNIDLQSNKGVVRVSPRLKINKQTSDLANLGCPVAFSPFNTSIFAVAGGRVFQSNSGYPNLAFAEHSGTGDGTDYDSNYSDLCQYNDLLFSTSPSKLRSLSGPGGTWTERDTFASTDEVHKLCYFKKLNRLYWTHNEQFINSCGTNYTPADSGDYTLSWDGLVAATDLKATNDYLWMAGKVDNLSRAETGVVWRWDGIATFKEFKVPGTTGVYALVIDTERDLPMAMGDNGVLYEFNGSGFSEVGRLPYKNHLPFAGANPIAASNTADRFIHPNGMVFTKNRTVLALIDGKNNDNSVTQEENIPSGIWEWSRENGFVHKHSFSYDPLTSSITDYGQFRVSRVGALALMNVPNTASGRDGTLLAGATFYTDASTTTSGIFFDNSLDTIQKTGYFVTTKIFSENVVDNWQKIFVRLKKLLDSSDLLTIKYRTSESEPTEATITWTSATTCTTTTNISAYVGYEMEVLQGKGSGKCSKISSVTESGGTYTITLQETFTGATSGTAKARFQYWREAGKFTPQSVLTNTADWFEASPLDTSTWIQFKVFMQFTGKDEINDLLIANTPSKQIE